MTHLPELTKIDKGILERPSDFRTILLATDFSAASDVASSTAIELSLELKSKLLILHVCEGDIGSAVGHRLFDQNEEKKSSLDRLVRQARKGGLQCERSIEAGQPAKVILDKVERGGIDLVVLGTRAIHGFGKFLFGSTAEAVLRDAPCPVLTVGPLAINTCLNHRGPVIFATDFHINTTHAICYAASLSSSTGAELHCLHILPRSLEAGGNTEIIPHVLTEALHHIAAENDADLLRPVYSVTYGSEVSNAIVEYARHHGARWIVLGVRKASIMAAHAPAHIVYRILAEAPCPVLTMAFPSTTSKIPAASCS